VEKSGVYLDAPDPELRLIFLAGLEEGENV
jgi:hypothetical protein